MRKASLMKKGKVLGSKGFWQKALGLVVSIVLAGVLVVSLFGCASPQKAQEESRGTLPKQESISQQDLAAELIDKYSYKDTVEYLPAIDPVPRDKNFTFSIGFNPLDFPDDYKESYDLVGVFADPELSQKAPMDFSYTKTGEKQFEITITPGNWAAAAIPNSIDNSLDGDKISQKIKDIEYIDDKGENNDWGNLPRYYLAQFADPETGQKLEKPLVQVFTVQAELPSPATSVFVDDYGKLSIKWKPVKGAERYAIYCYYHSIGVKDQFSWMGTAVDVVDSATTEWHTDSNLKFVPYSNLDELDESKDINQETTLKVKDFYREYIGVIALGANGHSSLDNLHKVKDLTNRLTYHVAKSVDNADYYNYINYIDALLESMDKIPSQIPVRMCDGSVVTKTVEFDYSGAQEKIERLADTDDKGAVTGSSDVPILQISFKLPKTDITGILRIQDYPANWREELLWIKQRQEGLMKAGLDLQSPETIQQRNTGGEPEPGSGGIESGVVAALDTPVFATNALSEFLAINMLAGTEVVPLNDFPMASDTNYLTDALLEAFYQNPLILGVSDMYLDKDNNLVLVYEDSPEARVQKQEAILNKIQGIIPQIITTNMTDLDKEIALNAYLCQNAEYDEELFASAQTNNFKYVDPKYNDSFTAYGALINGVCVCAGYTAAFKLLADAAGLEAIVVTGTLEGGLGHAWNRAFIGNEWLSIDPTNNDNDKLYNVLFNLPDDVVVGFLVEDKDYMLDSELANYHGVGDANEYYHVKGEFFDTDAIVDELAQGLKANGSVVLRTDYAISDEEFQQIGKMAQEKAGVGKVYGVYLLGLIYLTKESF